MNLNFEVSLDDIGTGLDLSGHSESERQEVMDFLVSVDENMADFDFSQELIYRLAENLTHDSEGYGSKSVALKGEQSGVTALYKSLSSVAEDLSHVDEEHLIVLMAEAIFRKREREAKAAVRAGEEAARRTEWLKRGAAEPCAICTHPNGMHNHQCELSRKGACHACMEADKKEEEKGAVCARPGCGHASHLHFGKQGFKEDTCTECSCPSVKTEWSQDPPCTRCGCGRELHRVNVGGERTGCYDHTWCDEWRQDKPLPLSAVCDVCGHTKNWHTHGRGSSCQVGPDTSPTTVYCSCLEFKEKQSWKLTERIDEAHSEEDQ